MDGERFDAWTRALVGGHPRRRVLRLLAASAAGSMLGGLGPHGVGPTPAGAAPVRGFCDADSVRACVAAVNEVELVGEFCARSMIAKSKRSRWRAWTGDPDKFEEKLEDAAKDAGCWAMVKEEAQRLRAECRTSPCPSGTVCVENVCCPPNTTVCGGVGCCDPARCQTCVGGNCLGCRTPKVCVRGECRCPAGTVGPDCECPRGKTRCGETCVDTQTDGANCGGCGARCSPGLGCCGGLCSDAQVDDRNCGACGAACDAPTTCCKGGCVITTCRGGKTFNANTCQCSCPSGTTLCVISDACVSTECPAGKIFNESSCACECPSGRTDCGETCVDTETDGANCGACGIACTSGEPCVRGYCCDGGRTVCGGYCVDTQTNHYNCGSCGTECAAEERCRGGACMSCDGAAHCGDGCCPAGYMCWGGGVCCGDTPPYCVCASGYTPCFGQCCPNGCCEGTCCVAG